MKPGTTLKKRYSIQKLIGQGGSAQTYLAEDTHTEQTVVVKILSIEALREWKNLDLFRREAELLKTFDHPLIPDYIDHFEFELSGSEGYALVQEYVDGINLSEAVKKGRRFTIEESRNILISLLETLVYLHSLKPPVIHRDIKPQNIIIDKENRIYLVDFSGAGFLKTTTAAAARSDTFIGTVGYMPPEQYYGKVYPQSDLYSLGITMIFLLTGKEPADMELKNLKPEYEKYIELPDDMKQIINLMIQMDTKNRPSSAKEALRLFTKYTFIKEVAHKKDPGKGFIETGPKNNPINFHYTKLFKYTATPQSKAFILNAIEFVVGHNGNIFSADWKKAGSFEWLGDKSPRATVTVSTSKNTTRIDLFQPAFFSGIMIFLSIFIVIFNMFVIGALNSIWPEIAKQILFINLYYVPWFTFSGGMILIYAVIKWIKEFRKARIRFRVLVRFLEHVFTKNTSEDFSTLLYELCASKDSLLQKQSFMNLNLWVTTKWKGLKESSTIKKDQILSVAQRVFVKTRGKIETHGLFSRWSHKKSPITISFLPIKDNTAILFQVDRRNYWGFYTMPAFGFLLTGWVFWLMSIPPGQIESGGSVVFPALVLAFILAPGCGAVINVIGTIIHRRILKNRLSYFVTALEELQE